MATEEAGLTGRELPVLAVGSEVLCVAGVELSDRIKRTRETVRPGYICFTKKSLSDCVCRRLLRKYASMAAAACLQEWVSR